jgi:hypothetical protein
MQTVENRLKKKQELMTNDLRAQVARYEQELKEVKGKNDKLEANYQKHVDAAEKKLATVSAK